jgi:hypothetical protein
MLTVAPRVVVEARSQNLRVSPAATVNLYLSACVGGAHSTELDALRALGTSSRTAAAAAASTTGMARTCGATRAADLESACISVN